MTKMMLKNKKIRRGHGTSDLGMLVATELFMLISIRRIVKSIPSLPGTASKFTAKLTQLVMTIMTHGKK